jgi:hypothetical protein
MTKKEVVSAAKELNKVLGLDPQIDTKQDLETLKNLVMQAAELIEPEDEISKKTMALIDALREEAATSESEEEEADIDEEEEGDDEPEEEGDDEPEEEADIDEEEEADIDEEYVEEAKEVKEKKKSDVKKPTKNPKDAPPATESKITRIAAAALVIKDKKGISIQEWVEQADEMYAKEGGKSNIKESKYAVNVTIKVLEAYGIIQVEENNVVKVI